MSRFIMFVTVVIVLAIVQAALAALVVALAIALLYAFVTRPRETLAFAVTLMLFGLASMRPTAFIIGVGIIALAVVSADALGKSRGRRHRTKQQTLAQLDRNPRG